MTWSCEMENWSLCPPDTEKVPGAGRPPLQQEQLTACSRPPGEGGRAGEPPELGASGCSHSQTRQNQVRCYNRHSSDSCTAKNKGVKNKQALGYQSSGRTAPLCKVPSWSSAERVQNSRSWDSQNHIICRRDRALLRLPICSSGL